MGEIDPTQSQGASAEAEGASDANASIEGTSADGTTVRDSEQSTQEGNGEQQQDDPNELRYSESTLAAERELAREEARNQARTDDAAARKKRYQELLTVAKDRGGEGPAVLRAVKVALSRLPELEEGESYTDDHFDTVIKTVQQGLDIWPEAALALADEAYASAIEALLGDEDAKTFWEEARGIDPTLNVSEVINLLIEKKALSSKSIRAADPEELIKLNPKLKAHFAKAGDEKYQAGRKQGRLDPAGDRAADAETQSPPRTNGNGSWATPQEAATLPIKELMRRRQEASRA